MMRKLNNGEYDNTYSYKPQKNGNSGLIIAVSVLASILVIAIILVTLFMTGVLSIGDNTDAIPNDSTVETLQGNNMAEAPVKAPEQVVKQPVPVEKTMYIGNCKQSVTMRTGPGTNFDGIRQIPLGEAVYVIEYTTDDFALVTYDGNRGYVMRDYVVSVRPQVWDYSEAEVENFVANSLIAFVNGINTGDTDYIYNYFSGSEADQEFKTHNQIYDAVYSEEILSLNCHTVQRISASQVTCIRDSVIRVTYNDGTVKDITEKYRYTVDLSSGRMYIVGLAAM